MNVAASNTESFHHYFLIFFRLYVRIFLNSFAIQASMPFVSVVIHFAFCRLLMMAQGNARPPNLYALSACTSSALECLRIASEEFREIHMLVRIRVMLFRCNHRLLCLSALRARCHRHHDSICGFNTS